MPLFHHPVIGPFARNGETVELARQADGEVADVDHFLHFAEPFAEDLARLDGDKFAERRLGLAEFFAEQAHQLAAAGRRNRPPEGKGFLRVHDRIADGRRYGIGDMGDDLACQGRMHGARASGMAIAGNAKRFQEGPSPCRERHDHVPLRLLRWPGARLQKAGALSPWIARNQPGGATSTPRRSQGWKAATICGVSGVGCRVASSISTLTDRADATHLPSENTT